MRRILCIIAALFFFSPASYAATRLLDEGVSQGFINEIDCSGAGISCGKSGIRGTLTVTGGGATGYATVQEEGTNLAQQTTLNFIGGAITAANSVSPARTDVTLSASPDSASVVGIGRTLTGGAGIAAIGDLSADRTISTASGEADFLASGALTCGASTQGKIQVHTTPLQYCNNAATPALQYAAYGNSTGVATSATILATARTIGGTSFDGSANIAIGALTSTNVGATTSLEFLGVISDETGTGKLTFATAPTFTTSLTTPAVISGNADPADAGAIRLGNAENIAWEASPAGTDVTLTVNTSEVLTSSGPISATTGFQIGGSATDDSALVGNGTNFVANAIPNCTDTSGNHLNYTTSSNAFSCGTSRSTTTYGQHFSPRSAKITGAYVVRTPTSGDASVGATIDAGDGNWRLLFDPTTDEAAVWDWVLPANRTAHGTFDVYYSMTSATSGTVEFEAEIMCTTSGDAADIGTASFPGVAVNGAETVPGTAGYMKKVTITLTDDSCAAGDLIYFYLSTDANDATNDTATGDREVVGIVYNYTGT